MGTDSSQKTEQANEPSGVVDALRMFAEEQAKSETPPQETEETHQPQEEATSTEEAQIEEESKVEPESEKEESSAKLPEPFKLVVDGKEIEIDDPEKLKTYAQQGYHYSQKMAELKKSEEMIQDILKAMQEGRLAITPPGQKPSIKEEAAEEELEDLDELDDPELARERKERLKLQQDYNKLKKDFKMLNQLVVTKFVEDVHQQMTKEINSFKEKYPMADDDKVWNFLAEKDPLTKKPKYTIEEAVKISHEAESKKFKEFLKTNPEFHKKTEEEKQAIIADYLKKQEEKKAPVSSPSQTIAQKTSDIKEEKEGIKGMGDAIERFNQWYKGQQKAGIST